MEAYNVIVIGANAGRGPRSAASVSGKRVLLYVWRLTASCPHADTRKEFPVYACASGHAANLTWGEP